MFHFSNGQALAIAIVPNIWKLDHPKYGHLCLVFKWFLTKWWPLSRFQMVGLLNFRSHSKSRLVRILDPHSSMTLLFITQLPYKMTPLWRHDACSSLFGTRERKREGKKSISPWMKYGHANLSSFCSYTNGGCRVINLSSLSLRIVRHTNLYLSICFTLTIFKCPSVSVYLNNSGFSLTPNTCTVFP